MHQQALLWNRILLNNSQKLYQPFSGDHSLAPSPCPPFPWLPPSSPPAPPAPHAPPAPPAPVPLLPGFGGGTGAPPAVCNPTKCSCPESLLRKCPPTFIIWPPIWPPTNFWRLSWKKDNHYNQPNGTQHIHLYFLIKHVSSSWRYTRWALLSTVSYECVL